MKEDPVPPFFLSLSLLNHLYRGYLFFSFFFSSLPSWGSFFSWHKVYISSFKSVKRNPTTLPERVLEFSQDGPLKLSPSLNLVVTMATRMKHADWFKPSRAIPVLKIVRWAMDWAKIKSGYYLKGKRKGLSSRMLLILPATTVKIFNVYIKK